MSLRIEIPFPPRINEPRETRVEPPRVPFEPGWEYKELIRDIDREGFPTEAELNSLGSEHWELAGVVRDEKRVYFYFKRERAH